MFGVNALFSIVYIFYNYYQCLERTLFMNTRSYYFILYGGHSVIEIIILKATEFG